MSFRSQGREVKVAFCKNLRNEMVCTHVCIYKLNSCVCPQVLYRQVKCVQIDRDIQNTKILTMGILERQCYGNFTSIIFCNFQIVYRECILLYTQKRNASLFFFPVYIFWSFYSGIMNKTGYFTFIVNKSKVFDSAVVCKSESESCSVMSNSL